MTSGVLGVAITSAGLVASPVLGPSWYRRWVLVSLGAIAVTGVVGLGLVLLLADDEPADGGPAQAVPPLGVIEHLAVFHVGEVPEPERAAFLDAAGLDVVHAPASCWLGLPDRLGTNPDELVLGVWAVTEDKLEAAMARLLGAPLLVAELENVCPTH